MLSVVKNKIRGYMNQTAKQLQVYIYYIISRLISTIPILNFV